MYFAPKLELVVFSVALTSCFLSEGNEDAKRLFDDLLKHYNKIGRPVRNVGDKVTIRMKLKLSQIIDVQEKGQIMISSVWVKQEWSDYKLSWEPHNYGGVNVLYVPAEMIWLPDIVLYNNADSYYNITIATKATVFANGTVRWEPPALYKSMCTINVEWFPFDEQTCHLKFGSWSYDSTLLDLSHMQPNATLIQEQRYDGSLENVTVVRNGIDLDDYYPSVEWEILEIPARRHNRHYQSCCPDADRYLDITYSITLRRKPLFYTVNLIFPCCGVTFLTIMVFYLPSDSGEKITLSISILVCLTVFFLLITEIIPSSSVVLPLIGKYLLFTMVMVTINVIVTVVALNVHFRTPSTHRMPKWVKKIFLQILPKYLLMERPMGKDDSFRRISTTKYDTTYVPDIPVINEPSAPSSECSHPICRRKSQESHNEVDEYDDDDDPQLYKTTSPLKKLENVSRAPVKKRQSVQFLVVPSFDTQKTLKASNPGTKNPQLEALYKSPPVLQAFENICFIAELLKKQDKDDRVDEDWKYVARVVDRLFLVIFSVAIVVGTLAILLQAPAFRDTRIACQPFCEENLMGSGQSVVDSF